MIVDTSTSFAGKTSGLRVRVLVQDIESLSEVVKVPGGSERQLKEHKLTPASHTNALDSSSVGI